jgi:hypothetical protein
MAVARALLAAKNFALVAAVAVQAVAHKSTVMKQGWTGARGLARARVAIFELVGHVK